MIDWANPNFVAAVISGAVALIGVIVSVLVATRQARTQVDIKARELAAQSEQRELEAASMRDLEFNKSELVVWVELRKDILAEMWASTFGLMRRPVEG